MKIACAFDHAGFPLKAMVLETVDKPCSVLCRIGGEVSVNASEVG